MERLLLAAEMMSMMKLYKDGNHREFTNLDIENFRGGGELEIIPTIFRLEFYYLLIYKPSYCNFLESRKNNYYKYYFFILSAESKYYLFS